MVPPSTRGLLSERERYQDVVLAGRLRHALARIALDASPRPIDALGENDSAKAVMADDQLRVIAKGVACTVRNNTTIDWRDRQPARANLRRLVRRVLRRRGYPPDKQELTVDLIILQAKEMAVLNA